MAACRDAGVPFKATAGLHHAIRADGAHGFLNLLAAAVFAHTEGLGEDELVALLAEEDADAFALDAAGLTAHGRHARTRGHRRGARGAVHRLRLVLVRRAGRGPCGARDTSGAMTATRRQFIAAGAGVALGSAFWRSALDAGRARRELLRGAAGRRPARPDAPARASARARSRAPGSP